MVWGQAAGLVSQLPQPIEAYHLAELIGFPSKELFNFPEETEHKGNYLTSKQGLYSDKNISFDSNSMITSEGCWTKC